MPEDEIVDILDLMIESIKLVQERFSGIGLLMILFPRRKGLPCLTQFP